MVAHSRVGSLEQHSRHLFCTLVSLFFFETPDSPFTDPPPLPFSFFFFFNDTATTEIYTLSLHDALPICADRRRWCGAARGMGEYGLIRPEPRDARDARRMRPHPVLGPASAAAAHRGRSEEHTSELQSRQYLVCRLLLEKKKKKNKKKAVEDKLRIHSISNKQIIYRKTRSTDVKLCAARISSTRNEWADQYVYTKRLDT